MTQQYLDILKNIIDTGIETPDRTKTGRIRTFGQTMRFKMSDGFPLLTTKKVGIRLIIEELLWFLAGSNNAQELVNKNVNIWNQWMVKETDIDPFINKFLSNRSIDEKYEIKQKFKKNLIGSIGNLYGMAFRSTPITQQSATKVMYENLASDKQALIKELFENEEFIKDNFETPSEVTIDQVSILVFSKSSDQIQNVIIGLKNNPYSARHIVSAWVPEFIADEALSPQENVMMGFGALAPCHVLQQYFVLPPLVEGGKMRLSLMMTQRSSDFPLGVPFNIASYSLLLMMIAQCVDMEANEFIWSSGDTHIYQNQLELAKEQITRVPGKLPTMKINPEKTDLFSFTVDDFTLEGYEPQAAIAYPVAT